MPNAPTDAEVSPDSQDLANTVFRGQMGRISQHSLVFFAGTMLTSVAGYFFRIYLARALGADALGLYALGMTLVSIASVLACVGLPQAAARYVAVYHGQGQTGLLSAFLWRAAGIVFAMSIILSIAIYAARASIVRHFYHVPTLEPYIGLFLVLLILSSLVTLLGQALAGFQDVARRTVITSFLGNPLTIILSLLLISRGMALRGYLMAQVLTTALVMVLLAAEVWKRLPTSGRGLGLRMPRVPAEVWLYSVSLLGVQGMELFLSQTDKILLGWYLNIKQVGIYAVALALVNFVPLFLQAVNQIFGAVIADLYARRQVQQLQRLYQSLTKWVLAATLPLALVLIIFAVPIMCLFGPEFCPGWPVLVIGAVGQIVNCSVGSVGLLLFMSGGQGRAMRVQVVTACVMLVCYFWWIPRWGMVGAAVAGAFANILINFLYLREVWKTLGLKPSLQSYWKLVPPTGLTVVAELLLQARHNFVHNGLALLFLALILAYGVFLIAAFTFSMDEDDRILARAVRNRISVVFGKVVSA